MSSAKFSSNKCVSEITNMKVLVAYCMFIKLSIAFASLSSIQTSDDLKFNGAAIRIIKTCTSHGIRTIGFIASTDYVLSELTSAGLFDITVIGNTTKLYKNPQAMKRVSYKLHNFVINAFSSSDLWNSLKILKSSIWWNYAGRFIIIERYPLINYCKNANDYLRALWKYNIQDGMFICAGLSAEVTIFGYNPYNEEHPPLWSLDHVEIDDKYDHPFAIFKRNFSTQFECDNIFFGQSSNLNGYPIKLNMKEYPPTAGTNIDRSSQLVIQNYNYYQTKDYFYVKITTSDWHNLYGVDSIMTEEFCKYYNATAIIKIYDNEELFGAVGEDGKFYGMLKDLKSGEIDSSFNNRFMYLKGDLPLTYPFQQSEITLVTHFRGDMNILMRIIHFINFEISISLLIIGSLTIAFFGYLTDKGIQLAILDTLQLLLGMSIPHIPFNSPPRIFLSCLMLYYFIISASLQSNMYAIVTVPQALQNVDSLDDLRHLTRKLYVNSVGAKVLGKNFHEHLEIIDTDHCIDRIMNKSDDGCIDDIYYLKHAAAKYELHIMKDGISKSYVVHPMRENWPLSQKLNSFNKKFNEAGILSLFWQKSVRAANEAIHHRAQKYKIKKFHVMTLSKCGSIFFILLVGCCISTIIFFMELQLFRYNKKYPDNYGCTSRRRIRTERMVELDLLRGCR